MRIALAAAALIAAALPAAAETIHVSPGPGSPIQDAVNSAQNGDVILIGKGTYRENVSVTAFTNLTLQAEGKVTLDGDFEEADDDVLSITSCSGVSVIGIRFRNAGDDGIDSRYCEDLAVRECTFLDAGDCGIEDITSSGFVVEDCVFARCGWGLAISYNNGTGTSGIEVRDSVFKKMGSYGIDFNGHDAIVENNRFVAAAEAIKVANGGAWTGALISGNRIAGSATVGINLNGGQHDVVGNTLRGCFVGIAVRGAGGHTITDNNVRGSTDVGIALESEGNVVTDNTALGSALFDLQSYVPEGVNMFFDNRFRKVAFPTET
jgi:parallel beta-helix repeat protein